ncbi:hypothetical protein TWF694_002485 [Orbilia ellipsospora]|uniref:Translation initiation factor IF-3 n=1 Tax=Orbilia ellipsospora TaxID=2528407 RepID=A0AAV9X3I3_9PEZI
MALRQISRATCRHLNRPTLSLLSIYTASPSSTPLSPPSFLLPFSNHERPTTIITPRIQIQPSQRRHTSNISIKFPVSPNLGPQFIEEARVRFPYDDEITAETPQFIDDEGKLVGTFPIAQILRSYDPAKFHLIHISGADTLPADATDGHIVRLFPKTLLLERLEAERLEARTKRKNKRNVSKEVQISWGIDQHDLGNHLRKVGKFLEKGFRVEVMFAKKKGQGKPTEEKLEAMMKTVEEFMLYNGGEAVKKPDGEVGGQLKMLVQRPEKWVPPPPKVEATEGESAGASAGAEGEKKKEHVPAWQARSEVS